MFGDILMWVLTVFGLIPMLKILFGPKKTFQEQLAEFSDDVDDCADDCAEWDEFGVLDEGTESNESNDALNDAEFTRFLQELGECGDRNDAEFTRFLQELGECGDEYRRFSMLTDFGLSRDSTRSASTGPK